MRNLKRDLNHLDGEIDSEGSWAISYGDMITLLLCFFILFFTTDAARDYRTRLTAAMLAAFEDNRKVEGAPPPRVLLDIGTKREEGIDLTLVKTWNGSAHQIGEKLLIEFPGVSFFKSGKTDLTPQGKKALVEFTQRFMPYAGQYIVNIVAFTDHRKVIKKKRGRKFDDNLELSALRAVSTMRSLQVNGIPLTRMRLGGHGELMTTAQELERLPASERAGKEMDLARRIVIVIEPEGRFGL